MSTENLKELARALNQAGESRIVRGLKNFADVGHGLVAKREVMDEGVEVDVEAADAEAKALLPFLHAKQALASVNDLLSFAMDHRDDKELMGPVLRSATKALRNVADTLETVK